VRLPLFLLSGHTCPVSALLLLPHSGHLASCGIDGALIFWDYVFQTVTGRLDHPHAMLCMALRADNGEILVGTQEGSILRFPIRVGPQPPPTQVRIL
jgi:WD40 repeat protein